MVELMFLYDCGFITENLSIEFAANWKFKVRLLFFIRFNNKAMSKSKKSIIPFGHLKSERQVRTVLFFAVFVPIDRTICII